MTHSNLHPTSPLNPLDTPAGLEIAQLKSRIAQVWAEREELKNALNQGALSFIHGMRKLEVVDLELAELDTRFKQLWDATNRKTGEKTGGKLNDSDMSQTNMKEVQ